MGFLLNDSDKGLNERSKLSVTAIDTSPKRLQRAMAKKKATSPQEDAAHLGALHVAVDASPFQTREAWGFPTTP
jgi:hypothetical protein